MTDHFDKAKQVIRSKGAKVVDRENNQRLRQIKESIRISQYPHVMNRNRGVGVCGGEGGGIQPDQHLQAFINH